MLKFFLIATLFLCFSVGVVFLAHTEDVLEIESLEPPPDGTDGLFYAVGTGHVKGWDSAAVGRFSKSPENENLSGALSITGALGVYGDVHTARTIAIQTARLELAQTLKSDVEKVDKFDETLEAFRTVSSSSITDNTLIGAHVIKTVITQQNGEHTVQVLMGMPIALNVAYLSVEEMNKEIGGTGAVELRHYLKGEAKTFDMYLAAQSHSEKKDLDWQQVADATAAYPEWFWHPPADLSFATAVGYASIASASDLALEQAIDNGIENLAKQHHIHIAGLIEFFAQELNKKVNGRMVTSVSYEEADAAVKEYIQRKHQVLATHRGELGTIVLVSLDKTSDLSSLTPDVNGAPPEWVTQLPSLPWYLYAHGVSSINPLPNEAWLEAEKDARAQLALSFGAKSTGIVENFEEQDGTSSHFQMVSETLTDVTLSGIETVSRWYDVQQHVCHVLIRVPIIQMNQSVLGGEAIKRWSDLKAFNAWKGHNELEKRLKRLEDEKRQDDLKENEQNGQQTEESDTSPTQ